MGAYLSEPIVDKISSDQVNDFLKVGSSSMQGWRKSQEDAHNCILSFDEITSIFAVYDGHGGAEVAAYCAENLPDFLKTLDSYKKGEFERSLVDTFLGFDAKLLEETVIEKLKEISGEKNPNMDSECEEGDEDVEDLDELCQEGVLPLDKVLEKYKERAASASMPIIKQLKETESRAGGSGTQPLSPSLRGKKVQAGPASSKQKEEVESTSNKGEADESAVSSSSSGKQTDDEDQRKQTNDAVPTTCSPDSSEIKGNIQNGSVTSCKDNVNTSSVTSAKLEGVTSSSSAETTVASTIKENGSASISESSSSSGRTTNNSKNPSIRGSDISSSTKANVSASTEEEKEDSSSDSDSNFVVDGGDNSSSEEDEEFCEPDEEDSEEGDEEEEEEEENPEDAYVSQEFANNMIEEPGKDSGCTAVVALLHGRDLYVANAGDSRCVVCRNGKAIEMSLDHKPEDEEETKRIHKAGGRITLDGRVNGGLNLSRAIGDHAYKMNKDLPPEKQMISAMPDIKKLIISPNDEFMVLACDGIWNHMSSDEVVEFIKSRIDSGKENMSEICEELFNNCLAPNTMGDGTGCDNMTAIIVRFQPKVLELPTKLNPEETEQEFLEKSKAIKTLKRSASPVDEKNENLTETNIKRLKTDTTTNDDGKMECDSGSALDLKEKIKTQIADDSSAVPTTTT